MQPIGDVFAGRPTATQFFDSAANRFTLLVFARLQDGTLACREFDILGSRSEGFRFVPRDASNQWQRTPAIIRGNPVAVQNRDAAWRVYMRGTDDALWLLWSNGTSRFGPEPIGGPGADGRFTSEMSAVFSGGLLHVFIRGLDAGLWQYVQPPGFPTMTEMNLHPLGGDFPGNPAAVAIGDGVIHVYVRGGDRFLWRQVFDGSAWRGWQPTGTGPLVGDPVPVVAREPRTGGQTVCVFYLDPSFRVRYRAMAAHDFALTGLGAVSGGQELTASPVGFPCAGSRSGNDFSVFARAPAGDVQFSFSALNAVAWSPFAPFSSVGALPTGPILTVPPPVGNVPPGGPDIPVTAGLGTFVHVLVRGPDGRLWHSMSDGTPFTP